MINLSIIDILKTNSFGPVSAGMNKSDVLLALGEPDDFEANDDDSFMKAAIWKYAGIELHFGQDEIGDTSLFLIWNDLFELLSEQKDGKNVRLDLSFLENGALVYRDLEDLLKENSLNWKIYRNKLSKSYFLLFDSGAGLHLEEYDDEIKLLSESKVIAITAAYPFSINNYEEINSSNNSEQ